MRGTSVRTLGLALVGLWICTPVGAQQPSPVQASLGSLATAFVDTPGGIGLVPTALAEAEIAVQHAELAIADSLDFIGIRRHVAHVIHALDPSVVAGGPGLGYGVRRAANEALIQAQMAAEADSVSENVTMHAQRMVTALTSTLQRVDETVTLARRLEDASSLAIAWPLAVRLDLLCRAVLYGTDANRDGIIGSEVPDGGVRQASYHLDALMRGEGLAP